MLESYDGVNKAEGFVTTSLIYYQEWLKREIGKRIKGLREDISQVSYLMSSYHLPNVLSRYSDTALFCSSI
jgi:hypothetical protein